MIIKEEEKWITKFLITMFLFSCLVAIVLSSEIETCYQDFCTYQSVLDYVVGND